MRRVFAGIAPILRLSRVTTAFAAVGNVWFVILWTRGVEEEPGTLPDAPLWALLLAGAVVASCLFVFGAALNDTLDVRRDRVLHPLRPLPAGKLNLDAAVGLVVLALMGAVLGATALGGSAVLMTLLTAAAIMFFNAAGKFIPSVGLVALSLIYASHMLIPNMRLVFVWPVWNVMTHALLVGALTHWVGGRRPSLSTVSVASAAAGWAFWSLALLWVGWRRGGLWPDFVAGWAAVGPALLAAGFAALAWRKTRSSKSGQRAAERLARYGALWLTLYLTAWLLGQGIYDGALILGSLAAAGFLGMTVLRELYALLEQPLAYRR